MRLSIYNPKAPAPPAEELCLKLEPNHTGRIQVIAVNPQTGVKLDAGVLIEFMDDGTFRRAPAIRAPGAGIMTDAGGRMIESGIYE